MIISRIVNKINNKVIIPLLRNRRRSKLKYADFTIISNNCWGGRCYEFFGLPKLSPTVGAYFYAEEYVKFCKNLTYYLSQKLTIIPVNQSKHKDEIYKRGEEKAIIGVLDDVEIVFLHYNDTKILLEKWERRIKRINWERIIIKFSYQNECSDELLQEFLQIKNYSKFVFVGEKVTGDKDEIIFKNAKGKTTVNETENFGLYCDVVSLINDRLNN